LPSLNWRTQVHSVQECSACGENHEVELVNVYPGLAMELWVFKCPTTGVVVTVRLNSNSKTEEPNV